MAISRCKSYCKRTALCVLGLALYGLGNFFGVMAGSAGTNAWNTLALGISGSTGFSFGTATFAISLAIILIDLLGRGKLGLGTVLNVFLIPVFSDLFLRVLAFVPPASGAMAGALYTLLGQTIISFATIVYMTPALGCGPRDTLMVLVGRRFPKAPIGAAKFLIELAALAAGFLLGAPFGIGTVLVMALQASLFQLACRITAYEPRQIVHEDLLDTWKIWTGSARKEK